MKTSLLLPVIMLLYLSNGAAQTNNTLLPPTYTAAYGYIITSPTYPQGPCKFFLEAPDSLIFLAPTTSPTPIHTSAWSNSTWYGAEDLNPSMGLNHGHLYSINTTTGAMTDIGPLGVSISGMAYDHSTGTLYGISSVPSGTGTYITSMYTINIANGLATNVNYFGSFLGHCISLSCNNAGMLFTVDVISGKICAIDPLTWNTEFFSNSPTGLGYLTDAEINKSNDSSYYTRNNSPTGALVTPSGDLNFPLNTQVTAMAIPFTYYQPNTDIGCMWLEFPITGYLSNTESVAVKIRNYGLTAAAGFTICYKFDYTPVHCEAWDIFGPGDPLLPGETYDWWFSTTVDCSDPGPHCIYAYVVPMPGDLNPLDNSVNKCFLNAYCGQINCYPNALIEPENCGDDLDGGCNSTSQVFVSILPGQAYCGIAWKVDTLRDTDWYRFSLSGTKSVMIKAIAEYDLDIVVVRLPCGNNNTMGTLMIPSCTEDSLVVSNLTAGNYAIMFSPDMQNYDIYCQGNTRYTFIFDTLNCQGCGSIQGEVKYDNAGQTILFDSVQLILTPPFPANPLNCNVDINGHFVFSNLPPVTYALTAQSTKKWGGANAVDALKILQNFVGTIPLSGLRLIAADVNASGIANAVDALNVLQRFIGTVSTFNAGDWAIETKTINMAGNPILYQSLKAICYGDVNGSYTPFAKSSDLPELSFKGDLVQNNGGLSIPVSFINGNDAANDPTMLGAVSLVLELPPELQVSNISPSDALAGDYFLYKTHGNILRLAWCRPEGSNLKDGDLLFTIYTNINALSSWEFAMRAESNFADVQGNAIAGAGISLPKLSTKGSSFSLSQNQPNPFSGETRISYDLPEDCQVKLTILDPLGRIIKKLVSEANTGGHHVVTFNGNSVSPGVYLYELHATGSVKTYQSTKMMLVEY